MAEKIVLTEFDIDINKLISSAAAVKAELDRTRTQLKVLTLEGKASTDEFVQRSVEVKKLSKQYSDYLNVLAKATGEGGKALTIDQRIEQAMSREINNIEDLREQNKELTKIRNQVNINTEEGQKQLAQLNAQLDTNNDLIKQNVSDLEQQKINIGDYANEIKEAFADTELFNGALGEMSAIFSKLSPALEGLTGQAKEGLKGFQNLTAGTEGLTGAQKASVISGNLLSASLKLLKVALIGTGIGAIVVLLGSLVAYFQSSEQAGNKLTKLMGALQAVVTQLMRVLVPLGEFIANQLLGAFDALGKLASKTLDGIAKGLKLLGFDNAAKSVDNFNKSAEKSVQIANALADARAKLTEQERQAGLIQLQYQRDAEKQRQIRDDENLSISQRIAANERLGQILIEQLNAEKAIAAQSLLAANLNVAAKDRTKEALDEQAEAMERMFDIEERITGQQSEQLANRVSLQKEAAQQAADAAAKAKEQAQARAQEMINEIELFKARQGVGAKSLEEQLALEEKVAEKRKAVLDFELKNRLTTQTEYNTAVLELDNELALRRAEIAQQNLDYELARTEESFAMQLALTKAKGIERIEFERRQAQEIANARALIEKQRFDQDLIDKETYRDNVIKIDQELQLKEIELNKQTDDILKERSQQNLEFKQERERLAMEEMFANEWELRELQIEQTRERDLAVARQQYTDKVMLTQAELLIEQQARVATAQMEKEKNMAIWQSRADLAGALSQLLGEETAVGKVAGIAQATISTYVGAAKALELGWPLGIIGAATIIANGLSTVSRIAGIGVGNTEIAIPSVNTSESTPAPQYTPIAAVPPFVDGGLVTDKTGAPIYRSNGDNILATLKKGEVVLNEKHQEALGGPAVFRAINVPGFATGGLVGGNISTVQNTLINQMDTQIADVIGDAVETGARIGTQSGSRQGIVDSATSNYIQRLSES